MNISFEKTLMLDVTKNIHALFQQGVIDASKRSDLIKMLTEKDYESLFSSVNELFVKSGNASAKSISDAIFNLTANN